MGNIAQQCQFGLFQDSDFPRDLEDSKSTSGAFCVFGRYTFVAISWMCKKQTCVSHSSTEAEIISLDTGLRMDRIPALDLWDSVIEVLHPDSNRKQKLKPKRRNPSRNKASEKKQCNTQNYLKWSHVDFVPSNAKCSHEGMKLYIFGHNEALIKMIMKGRSPNLRHVSRTHRVALYWLLERTNLNPRILNIFEDNGAVIK